MPVDLVVSSGGCERPHVYFHSVPPSVLVLIPKFCLDVGVWAQTDFSGVHMPLNV